ncbi:MAG: phenylacetate--CoA ligase family protein [Gemmataceae bacterium]
MAHLQLNKVPGNAWPGVPRGEISQLWAMVLELERTQWLKPDALAEGQLSQVRVLLEHCSRHVPYYRDTFKDAGIRSETIHTLDDFRRIPILQRHTYQEQFARFQATSLPAGTVQTAKLRTSGTSGMPIEVWQTNLVNLWWFAFHLRDFQWCDFDLQGSLAVIRSLGGSKSERQRLLDGVTLPCWSQQLQSLVENGPAFAIDIHQDPRQQLEWLVRIRPNYLLSYPPNLEFLASLLGEKRTGLPGLRAIQSIGETLTGDARERIQTGFGVPVYNTYSCVEAGYLASPCPAGHGLHIHGENVLLEVVDEAGRPCQPGQTGRVILTALHNFLTPFIRYEILDGATLGPPVCACGRGLPLLTQVEGKRRPQFRLAGGRRKDSGYLVRQLRKLGAYHQHQIVQKAIDHIEVRLIPGQGWTADHAGRIIRAVQEYFETPIRIDIQTVDALETTPAGKFRDVIVDEAI